MTRPSRDSYPENEVPECDLLGYVLGALDENEAERVAEKIREQPELGLELERIQNSIQPLEVLREVPAAPAGLARRTIEHVAIHRNVADITTDSQPAVEQSKATNRSAVAVQFSEPNIIAGSGRSWSRANVFAIAASILILASVVIPAVNQSRFQSRIVSCQNNLREIGTALFSYADNHGGRYLEVPSNHNLAFAGSYAPTLLQHNLVSNENRFFCAGNQTSGNQANKVRFIPSIDELTEATGVELVNLQRVAGGDYGYPLGYSEDGNYKAPRRRGQASFAVLADSPSSNRAGRISSNHGGIGQNCFFDDGHIEFISNSSIGSDAIYENDLGQIAPGAHEHDSVIAPGYVRFDVQ